MSLPRAIPSQNEPIVIALVSHGWTARGYEAEDSIKGSHHSVPVCIKGILQNAALGSWYHILFVVGVEDEERIRDWIHINAPPHPATTTIRPVRFTFEFHQLNETQLEVWMKYIGHTPSHRTGPAGNVKFFYPLMFPHLSRLLMLDTDVLISSDVAGLWALFRNFHTGQLYSMAPQWRSYSTSKDNQLNAGVMLLDLHAMRNAAWLELARQSIQQWDKKKMTPRCCAHGDQSAFHMVRWFKPTALQFLLPRGWNLNKCHQYQHVERMAPGSYFVGIVHLGCCKLCTREKIGRRWAKLFDAIWNWPLREQSHVQVVESSMLKN